MFTKQISEMKYEVIFESEDEVKKFNDFMFPKKWFKAADVMRILGINRVTLSHYVTRGLLKVDPDYTGKQYRYDYDSVMELKTKKGR